MSLEGIDCFKDGHVYPRWSISILVLHGNCLHNAVLLPNGFQFRIVITKNAKWEIKWLDRQKIRLNGLLGDSKVSLTGLARARLKGKLITTQTTIQNDS